MTLTEFTIPQDPQHISIWLAVLGSAYFVVAECVHRVRDRLVAEYELPHNLVFRDVFDGLVFANSVMLFLSFFEPKLLDFLDQHHIYVLLASFMGLYFAFRGLWPPIKRNNHSMERPAAPSSGALPAPVSPAQQIAG